MKLLFTCILTIFITFSADAQNQTQAGIDLAASFPQVTEGNVEPDLPADGFWISQQYNNTGINMETQTNVNTGYFFFAAGYFYDASGSPFWCVISHPYDFNPDVNHWRDNKSFSNQPNGHNESPVMAEFDADCNVMDDGVPVGSATIHPAVIVDSYPVHLLFRDPGHLEFTIAGRTYEYVKFGWRDNLHTPSMDWVTDYTWHITGSASVYVNSGNTDTTSSKLVFNFNVNTDFEVFDDISLHPQVMAYVGDKPEYAYYISDVKSSFRDVAFFNYDTAAVDAYEPYMYGTNSNRYWVLLVHDPIKRTVMMYTVSGDKYTQNGLSADAGIPLKFKAMANPDDDVINFYPAKCEGVNGLNDTNCSRTVAVNRNDSMATWSPQNVHSSTMKMMKLGVGGKRYKYHANNGESDSQAMARIKQMMVDDGTIEAGDG